MAEEFPPKIQKLILADSIFTPAAPIDKKDLFAGRVEQIKLVYDTINERGRHAIMYGERGVGKTSLANIINELLPKALVVKVSCDTSDNFSTIWYKLLKRITLTHEQQKLVGYKERKEEQVITLNGLLPRDGKGRLKGVLPDNIISIFEKTKVFTILILDEFDRITDERTKDLFSDIIKSFSDTIPFITLVLVGVARTVEDLIGSHASIERNLRQIRLPRMSADELEEIINKGLTTLQLNISPELILHITRLSQGFPHYTHLLAKYSAKQAINAERNEILLADFKIAIERAIEDTQESIREAYQRATIATKKSMFHEVLLACALAKEDEHGTFQVRDVQEPLRMVAGKEHKLTDFIYHIGKLCSEERGNVLEKEGRPKRFRYRFKNPLLKPYAILRGISTGILKEDLLLLI
ncbi:ATP-binding protein [Candidatus Omnitrophota bacterium]